MCLIGIVGRPVVSWGVLGCLGCPGVIRLTAIDENFYLQRGRQEC